jgi:hypothetical protein
MKCGCSYELFMHLNPHRLEPFWESDRLRNKEQMEIQKSIAWLQGMYNRVAMISAINRNVRYPNSPYDMQNEMRGQTDDEGNFSMTDGQRFALFMVKHNKARKK